jgi:hypothetical protein
MALKFLKHTEMAPCIPENIQHQGILIKLQDFKEKGSPLRI